MEAAAAGLGVFFWLVFTLAFALLPIICCWIIFKKAGQPGWAAIIPIYNTITIINIAKKPLWWFFMLLIPFVNIVFSILIFLAFAKAFGKGVGFMLGMWFLPFIFYPILAFGDAQYDPSRLEE